MSLPTVNNTTRAQRRGFDAQLGDLLLRLAVGPGRELRVQSDDGQAEQVDTAQTPEEMRSSHGTTFARGDFTGGSGLDRAHKRDLPPGSEARYWDSRGVRIERPRPGHRRELSLLEDTESALQTSETGLRVLALGGEVFVAAGDDVRVSSDPLAATPTFDTEDPHDGETAERVRGLAALGGEVYAALGSNGIHVRDGSGSWSGWFAFTDDDAVGVWAAKGRVIASTGRGLHEIAGSTPSEELLRTLAPGESWVAVVDGGPAILAAATDGYVYAFAPDESGDLALASQTLFDHEAPTALAALPSQGLVMVATDRGEGAALWRLDVAEDGRLGGGQVVRRTDSPAVALVTERDSVYAVVAEDGEAHSYRYDVVTGGAHRWWVYDGSDPADAALVDGNLLVALDGDGVRRVADTLVDEGWLITPLADFFTAERKNWTTAFLEADDLAGSGGADLLYSTDPAALLDDGHSSWVRITTASEAVARDEAAMSGVDARFIAGQVRLRSGSAGGQSPTVRSLGFQGTLATGSVVVSLPVNVSDRLESPGRRPLRVPGHGQRVYRELRDRAGAPALLRLPRLRERVRGTIESVETPSMQMGPRGTPLLVSMVTVRGRRVSATRETGVGPIGTHLIGALPVGGVDG